eukprot:gene38280-20887_t
MRPLLLLAVAAAAAAAGLCEMDLQNNPYRKKIAPLNRVDLRYTQRQYKEL